MTASPKKSGEKCAPAQRGPFRFKNLNGCGRQNNDPRWISQFCACVRLQGKGEARLLISCPQYRVIILDCSGGANIITVYTVFYGPSEWKGNWKRQPEERQNNKGSAQHGWFPRRR